MSKNKNYTETTLETKWNWTAFKTKRKKEKLMKHKNYVNKSANQMQLKVIIMLSPSVPVVLIIVYQNPTVYPRNHIWHPSAVYHIIQIILPPSWRVNKTTTYKNNNIKKEKKSALQWSRGFLFPAGWLCVGPHWAWLSGSRCCPPERTHCWGPDHRHWCSPAGTTGPLTCSYWPAWQCVAEIKKNKIKTKYNPA